MAIVARSRSPALSGQSLTNFESGHWSIAFSEHYRACRSRSWMRRKTSPARIFVLDHETGDCIVFRQVLSVEFACPAGTKMDQRRILSSALATLPCLPRGRSTRTWRSITPRQSGGCDLTGRRSDVPSCSVVPISQRAAWRSKVCASKKLMRLIRSENDPRWASGKSFGFMLSVDSGKPLEKRHPSSEWIGQTPERFRKQTAWYMKKRGKLRHAAALIGRFSGKNRKDNGSR